MFYEEILMVQDRSYYVDELVKRTSHPRGHWSNFSLSTLRKLLMDEVRKIRKEEARGYQKVS